MKLYYDTKIGIAFLIINPTVILVNKLVLSIYLNLGCSYMALLSVKFKEMETVRFAALLQLLLYLYTKIFDCISLSNACGLVVSYCGYVYRIIEKIFTSYLFLLQFRALSDQIYDSPEHHMSVRQQVVTQVCTRWSRILLFMYDIMFTFATIVSVDTDVYFTQMVCSISWNRTQRCIRDMFLWSTESIWRRWPSINWTPLYIFCH